MPYFGKSEKNFFLLEKNPTSSSKMGGLWGKKSSSDFLGVFSEIKFRWNKCAAIWKICEKHFFTGKKSDFKFQNRGYFRKKNVPQNLSNFGHN